MVRGVTARAMASGETFKVRGSRSANTGRAPVRSTASAVNAADSGEVTTSSPGPDAQGDEAELERLGAVRHRHRVPGAERRRQLLLEGLDLGPEDEPAGVEHPRDGRVQLRPQRQPRAT